jgi:hypothetical protein
MRLRRAQCLEGTASVEVVVMLPLFIALLFAVSYLHGLGSAFLEAKNAARACAWTHALRGCADRLPPVCKAIGLGKSDGMRLSLAGSELEVRRDGTFELQRSYFDEVAAIPLVGAAVASVFGVGQRISATRTAPGYAGAREQVIAESVYVLCNSQAASWSDKVEELLEWFRD